MLWLVARRPDRITTLVGLAVLALAFFVLPTRVHERYLFPLVAIGAILAAVSWRWRVAYILSAAATFANMYVVLTTYYQDNPGISDWLNAGPRSRRPGGVAIASVTQAVVLGWAFFQLRAEAVEGIAEDIAIAGHGSGERGRPRQVGSAGDRPRAAGATRTIPRISPDEAGRAPRRPPVRGWRRQSAGRETRHVRGPAGRRGADDVLPAGTWTGVGHARAAGLASAPASATLPSAPTVQQLLEGERGGRLDRLDVWMLAVLAISLLTVRMWRLDEPYQMHFDEVYHPRTATEFLQDWRYGLSHDIYEWTHPHLAKYAMAAGWSCWARTRSAPRAGSGRAVLDAVIEPRRDESLDSDRVEGDRLWVATGSEVRAYDLATRELAGTLALPDAVALAYDTTSETLYVGTRGGRDSRRRCRGPGRVPTGSAGRGRIARLSWTSAARSSSLLLTRDGDRPRGSAHPGLRLG